MIIKFKHSIYLYGVKFISRNSPNEMARRIFDTYRQIYYTIELKSQARITIYTVIYQVRI